MADNATMARPVRFNIAGTVYHLISRFVDRNWFIEHEAERRGYIRFLGRALLDSDWRCLAYAIMSNHIHLAVVAGEEPMVSWVRRVHAPFAGWMNHRRNRIGSIFVRGPKDFATPPERVARLLAYIHNNPVRAGLVTKAADSTWTSHAAYLGHATRPRWLDVSEGLARAGMQSARELDRWVNQDPGEAPSIDLDRVLRAAHQRGAMEVATPVTSEVPVTLIVARPWAHVRLDPRTVVQLAAREAGLAVEELCSRRKNAEVVEGRLLAVHAGRALGLSVAHIAAALGMTQQGGSKLSRRSLEQQTLEKLEHLMSSLRGLASP